MSAPRRQQDEEPLTQLDVNIDTRHLDSIEGEASTSPGMNDLQTDPGVRTSPGSEPPTRIVDGADGASGPDNEPQTMEPQKVMGVPRLRAPTIMGVAPPSSGGKAPPTTNPAPSPAAVTPKRSNDDGEEQTTLVGKLLAEAHAEVAKRLKGRGEPKEADLYADETATTVGDAEKLIAAANAAAFGKANEGAINDDIEEPTESRSVKDALVEDVTSKRDAINIDSALARAAELRAEAEARKKRAMKKRTIHGLGDGPLTLPASGGSQDDIPTFENKVDKKRESDKLLVATPADTEMETLSVGAPRPAPFPSLHTEPETLPVQVPQTPRGGMPKAQGVNATLLAGHAPPTGPQLPAVPPSAPGLAAASMNNPGVPYTQPLPHTSTMRVDENGGAPVDPALRATMQASPGNGMYAQQPHAFPGTPPGGVPHYHSTPMPVPAPFTGAHPHADAAAFARTAVATGSGPALPAEPPEKKGGKGGLIFFLLFLATVGGVGYWQRVRVIDSWNRYRHPPPPATAAPTASTAVTPSAGPSTTPPVGTDSASPNGSASAAASASASASPSGSSSAAPRASASASAAPSSSASAKPPVKKPPPWRPPPQKPKPKPAVPKPVDDGRGF